MLQNLYQSAERPYYHQGCWENVPKETVRFEAIKATAYNTEGDEFEINVEYYVVNERTVTVTSYDKLECLSDVQTDIIEAITAIEKKSYRDINFAL